MNLRASCDRRVASDSPGFGEIARRSKWSLNGKMKKKSVNIHSVHRSYLLVVLCNFVCMCNKIIPTVKNEIIKEKLVKST